MFAFGLLSKFYFSLTSASYEELSQWSSERVRKAFDPERNSLCPELLTLKGADLDGLKGRHEAAWRSSTAFSWLWRCERPSHANRKVLKLVIFDTASRCCNAVMVSIPD